MSETICQECGMQLDDPNEYHPYAACLMFKGCHDERKVFANLDAVRASGAQWEADHATEPLRDRLAAIERQVLWRTEDMPKEAHRWIKNLYIDGCWWDCDVDAKLPAPDYRPDEPGPLFLPILHSPEGA